MKRIFYTLVEHGTFRASFKCGADPLTGAIFGGISAIGGMASAGINASSQRATNRANLQMTRETNQANKEINEATNRANLQSTTATNQANLQMTRETNATNERLQREMNDFNLEQWNRNNEYNSPEAQKGRLMAAGYNPNLFGTGAVSESSPVQQTTLPTVENPQFSAANFQSYTEQAAHFNAVNYGAIAEATGEAPLRIAEAEKLRAEADMLNRENKRQKDEDKFYNNKDGFTLEEPMYRVDGKEMTITQAMKYIEEHPDVSELPEPISKPTLKFNSKGDYDAYMKHMENKTLYKEQQLRSLSAEVEKAIKGIQSDNPKLLKAIADIPSKEYEKLVKDIAKVTEDIDTVKQNRENLKLTYDIEQWKWDDLKTSSFRRIINEYLDGELDGKKLFGTICGLILEKLLRQ